MAENRNWAARAGAGTGAVAFDQGLRSYMLGVYNYMAGGLAITGVVAFVLSRMLVDATGHFTQLAHVMYGSPLQWVIMLAPLGVVLFMGARIRKMSVSAAQTTFWIFAALMGLSLASIFIVYTGMSIATTFFAAAGAFGGLSIWGYSTKRDLSAMGSFLFIGLIGLIIAMVVNMFMHSPTMTYAISAIGVLIFAGLTAWDTQRIKEMYSASDDGLVVGRKSIMGALSLYLDFINLFLFLLQFMGARR
jgi:FtsH-binding integral membrane protein